VTLWGTPVGPTPVRGAGPGGLDRSAWARVGYLVETASAYPELTVRENLELMRRLRRLADRRAVGRGDRAAGADPICRAAGQHPVVGQRVATGPGEGAHPPAGAAGARRAGQWPRPGRGGRDPTSAARPRSHGTGLSVQPHSGRGCRAGDPDQDHPRGWPCLAPAAAAFLVTAWAGRRWGAADLLARMGRWWFPLRWWAVTRQPAGVPGCGAARPGSHRGSARAL
jgi:hypothetical protein